MKTSRLCMCYSIYRSGTYLPLRFFLCLFQNCPVSIYFIASDSNRIGITEFCCKSNWLHRHRIFFRINVFIVWVAVFCDNREIQ